MIENGTTLFTIGFTKKTAEEFFARLRKAEVRRVIDVRLNNTGQLAGFSKRDDLAFFLKAIGHMDYLHVPDLAPTSEMLRAYRSKAMSWQEYEHAYRALLSVRNVEKTLSETLRNGDCLLCSEPTAAHCHRRVAAEYLQQHCANLEISHL